MNKARQKHLFLFDKKPIETGQSCRYYPCHFAGQDCTWCYCPLYPCLDPETNGKWVRSKKTGEPVWSCAECHWVHDKKAADKLKRIIQDRNQLPDESRFEYLLSIRKELRERPSH